MKKIIMLLMLIAGINGQLFAQESNKTNTEKIFELPGNSIKRKFIIELDKGNRMQVELTSLDELNNLQNLDSLVKLFLDDITALKDSLSNELEVKRIDYICDSSNYKKIRITRHQNSSSSFAIMNGEVSQLKLEQDTITLTGKVQGNVNGILNRKIQGIHYYRVSFFLNDFNELAGYTGGLLNDKISLLKQLSRNSWEKNSDGSLHSKKYPEIKDIAPNGYMGSGDFLSLRASIDIQNYKNFFVPSASIGFAAIINNNLVRHEFGLNGEFHFIFAKNSNNKLEAFRNTFLTISYGRGSLNDQEVKKNGNLYPFISLGYLIKRRGDFYDKNTFKLGLGRWSFMGGMTKIEPCLYFNNFFKGVTPSLRITQNF